MFNLKHTSKTSYEETQFEWEFPDVVLLIRNAAASSFRSNTFSFGKSSWNLVLERTCFNQMDLYIGNAGSDKEIEVEYEIGLKKIDGSVEHFHTNRHDFIAGLLYCINGISISELLERNYELTPPNGVTITCTLRRGIAHSHSVQQYMHEAPPLRLIKLDTLSENFGSLCDHKDSCDVILQVQDREFYAHKAILAVRSSAFAAMFEYDTLEKEADILHIADCDPESFEEFLKFLYCGKLEDITFRSAFHLFKTSHKYGVLELKDFCVEYMEWYLEVDVVCDVVQLADKYDEEKLWDAAQNIFNKNISKVLDTDEWDSLLKNNYSLAKKLLKGMASKVKIED